MFPHPVSTRPSAKKPGDKMKETTVAIADLDLELSHHICVRTGLDEETVRNYAACFDQLPPIQVFDLDGRLVVVDGNHRTHAAQRLGLTDIAAEVKPGTLEEAREAAALANVAHGKPLNTAEKRKAIDAVLVCKPERSDNWVAKLVGVDRKTVHKRREALEAGREFPTLSELVGEDGKTYPRELELTLTGEPAPKVFPGKVHTLDVLEGLRELDAASVALCFTDPPYNLGVEYDTRGDEKHAGKYLDWCNEWFAEVRRVLADTGSFYVMHYPETCAQWYRELSRLFTVRRWLTWVYPCNVGQSESNWTRAQRAILFCTKGENYTFNSLADPQAFRNPKDKRIKELVANGQPGVTPYDWWEFDLVKNVSAEKTEWPNQLPVGLVERIVKVSSNEGDLVLDPFMGSGTTAEAAARNGRQWIGFDTNPKSAEVTARRLA